MITKEPIWELPTFPETAQVENQFYNFYITNQIATPKNTIFGVSKNSGEKYDLLYCIRCRKDNLPAAQYSGTCIWCGFNINPPLTEETQEHYYNRTALGI